MLRPRIIPCLLIHDGGLVKTQKFANSKYVGDPINAVKIFNEKEADELMVIDIDATRQNRPPEINLLKKLSVESRMPLCYGGGIKTVEQAKEIVSAGIEKVAISSAAIENPGIVSQISREIGSQSIAVVLDIKKKSFSNKYEIWTHNNSINTKLDPIEFSRKFQDQGAGEIIINCIEEDGMMSGFDFPILEKIYGQINIPMTIMGGVGSYTDIKAAIQKFRYIGIGVGSLFVFKGKYRAVLINYPTIKERDELYV
ncbi:AglZ/HisF2 family acetamidino modification protein [Leptospira brenneri]|uniref:imidazole glycerol-phosphate synthase n=1 Tax=Leptospira brenneri TaxID=2023182 RepID=A0A2M9Y1P9_9LEPT|nr:AglZ/HisF2 family acetamidino modification protein [Leptospira brenneri]PJZ45500.1 imidazole glycerol phosphate synthase subunit HisF [Leptospira brenneri]TGK91992.1 imidazole glycerol phosphate synthase cyclase subunit [Leptospira brenneri]